MRGDFIVIPENPKNANMERCIATLSEAARLAWRFLLRYDNTILGIVLIPIALNIWTQLYKGTIQYWPYISAGFYAKPVFSLSAAAFSAIYVTGTSILLLTLGR